MSKVGWYCVVFFLFLVSEFATQAQDVAGGDRQKKDLKSSVGGYVVGHRGEAIPGATVRLQRDDTFGGAQSTSTDETGRFTFASVDPGRYSLMASHEGYLSGMNQPSHRLSLASGERKPVLTITLTPAGTISGSVTDSAGKPVSSRISAYRWLYPKGRPRLVAVGEARSDSGSFVLAGLAPGKYLLAAEAERSRIPDSQKRYVRSFYPDAEDPGVAAPIFVTSGSEVPGITIQLREERTYNVSGKVIIPGANVSLASELFILSSDRFAGLMAFTSRMEVSPDSSFEFTGLLPGSYVIRGGTQNPRNQLFAYQPLSIGDRDVKDLKVYLEPGARITGRIEPDQESLTNSRTKGRVTLSPEDAQALGSWKPKSAESSSDSTFEIIGIPPDIYSIKWQAALSGGFVKSVKLNGVDANPQFIDLTSTRYGAIDVVISQDAATVSGTVRRENGAGAAGSLVTLWSTDSDLVAASATADDAGRFRFDGLPPGDYRTAAWEEVDPGIVFSPEFRRSFDAQTSSVSLGAREVRSLDLPLISSEAVHSEFARVR
jgi:hypothetical protein